MERQTQGAVVSIAGDKLRPQPMPGGTAARLVGGLWTGLKAQHPTLAALLVHAAKVGGWVAFYAAVRMLAG
jgi:hypothetical protein